jgi:hypothetical protein
MSEENADILGGFANAAYAENNLLVKPTYLWFSPGYWRWVCVLIMITYAAVVLAFWVYIFFFGIWMGTYGKSAWTSFSCFLVRPPPGYLIFLY